MQQGDLVFCHGSNIISKAIRFGEWIRFRRGSYYNHVAVLNQPLPDGEWSVFQAEARGVTSTATLSSLGEYVVVPAPTGTEPEDIVRFMQAQVGDRYGWVSILSLVLTIIGPNWLNIMRPGTWICSAVAGEALRFSGWLNNWPDVYQVTPSALWSALNPMQQSVCEATAPWK